MDVVSVFCHLTEGMFGRTDQTVEEAQQQARQFASEHYPGVPTMDPWTLTGWWLLKDDNLPFFHPKPWPIAFALKKASVCAQMDSIPKYMILLATTSSYFGFQKAERLDEAREKIEKITKGQVSLVENPHGGLTGTYTDEKGTKHIVAHVIAL